MIDHLRLAHDTTKETPAMSQTGGSSTGSRTVRIEAAFSSALSRIIFNKDIFWLLLRRIITNNISFAEWRMDRFAPFLCIFTCEPSII